MQWNLRVHAIGIDPENLAFIRVAGDLQGRLGNGVDGEALYLSRLWCGSPRAEPRPPGHAGALHGQLTASGMRIVKALSDADYGPRPFVLAEPGGHCIDVGEAL